MTEVNAITALNMAQADMGAAIKNQKNDFLRNSYADLSAVQEAVFPAFAAHGFAITQEGGRDDFGQYMDTVLRHVSGENFTSRIYLEYKKGDMQSLGGAITYARRYGLLSITGIPIADDDGNAAVGSKEVQEKVMGQAKGLESFMARNPSAEDVAAKRQKKQQVIEGLGKFNQEYATRLNNAWQQLEKKVGL